MALSRPGQQPYEIHAHLFEKVPKDGKRKATGLELFERKGLLTLRSVLAEFADLSHHACPVETVLDLLKVLRVVR